ncbi:MAG TPA: P-loop NTPase fold protein [Pirellulales bacterium]|jgi:hypothetical protein
MAAEETANSTLNASSELTGNHRSGPSIDANSVSDRVASVDHLGFGPYVLALAKFLKSPGTMPPLTVSIEGAWGSGKSSFMEQLAEQLEADGTPLRGKKPSNSRPVIVRFNAWLHDKDEELWASFALAFTGTVRRQSSFVTRCTAPIRLFIQRFNWAEGWFDALFALCLWTALVLLAISLPTLVFYHGTPWAENLSNQLAMLGSEKGGDSKTVDGQGEPNGGGIVASGRQRPRGASALTTLVFGTGSAASVAISLLIWFQARKLVGNPLEIKLREHVNKPNYEGRLSFIDNLQADFRKVVNAYVYRQNRIYVFIDDLDRCAVPKAAELMGAINLLISDDERLIFIIGMDRKTVAAGIAVKYESLLPYLSPNLSDSASASTIVRRDLDFGYAFLEKFIQLPFAVPAAGQTQLKSFLKSISRGSVVADAPGGRFENIWRRLASYVSTSGQRKKTPAEFEGGQNTRRDVAIGSRESNSTATNEQQIHRDAFILLLEGDDSLIADVALMAAPALDANPRRLKQFVNLFRLKFYIAVQTGLLDSIDGRRKLTPQQLGKLTAVFLRWPGFANAWLVNPSLLARLDAIANSDEVTPNIRPQEQYWSEQAELMNLIRYGCVKDGQFAGEPDRSVFGLSEVQCEELLQVSPARPEPSNTQSNVGGRREREGNDLETAQIKREARAQMDSFAVEYEKVRKTQAPGDRRTAEMDAIVLRIRSAALKAAIEFDEIVGWFQGSDGQRIVALACLQAAPSPEGLPLLLTAIGDPRSPFEQYHAMIATDLVKTQLNEDSIRRLLGTLESQLPVLEKSNDSSRLRLLRGLLDFFGSQGREAIANRISTTREHEVPDRGGSFGSGQGT